MNERYRKLGQTDRQQTDRQTDRQKHTDRQKGRTDIHMHTVLLTDWFFVNERHPGC